MTTVDRRTVLRGIAALSSIAAGSALARTPASASSTESGSVPTWAKTPCRFCGVGCGLLIGIEGGRAGAVRGDPDSPVGRGLACAKGYFSAQALYGDGRLTRPMVRRNGRLEPVAMGEALDLVATRIRETIERHGKDSVAMYGSAQWSIPDAYTATKFLKGALGTNNLETSDRLFAGAAMEGARTTFGLDGAPGCYEDIEHADVFVLWDINLAETEPVLFSRMLERRRRDPGVRIVELATRTTRTSYAADQSLLHAPHSVVALANAICAELLRTHGIDRDFVSRHVSFLKGRTDLGYGRDGAAPATDAGQPASWDDAVAFFAEYSPQRTEELSGIAPERVRWLASLYADRSRRVLSVWGANVSEHARGTWANNALYNIHLLSGRIGEPGNGALCLTGQPGGGCAVHEAGARADALPRGTVTSEADRKRASAIWRSPPVDATPGPRGLDLFRAFERGDVRLLWIQATNPMVSLPNLRRYRASAARDDRVLIVSEAYPTPTTDVADIVLPAAMWFEREGIYANGERRLQHFAKLVEPPGEAMSDAWQVIEVARRLGHEALFPWNREEHIAGIWEEYARFHDGPASALPSLETLRDRPGVMWPFAEERETKWRYAPSHDPAADRASGRVDFYGYADHRARVWLRPHQPPSDPPTDRYPFTLTIGAVLEHWGSGSMTQRIPTLHRAVPRAYLEMNGGDAERLGIRHGDVVRLTSARAAVDIPVRIDYRSQPAPGQLFVPWFDEAVSVRALLDDAVCPLSGQPETRRCAVRVDPRSPGAA